MGYALDVRRIKTTNAIAIRASAISVLISRRRTDQRKPMRFGGQ
jgi:hypothetical protein